MKKLVLLNLVFLFVSTYTYSQNKECNCSDALDESLKDKYKRIDLQSLRSEMYEFYEYTKTDDFKSGKKFNLSGEGNALTNYGYFEGFFNMKKSKRKSKYLRIDEKIEKDKRISINTFKEILKDDFSKNQLTAYESCLDLCATTNANGVFYEIGGDLEDVFSINIIFRNTVGKDSITIKDNPTFINCDPIGGIKLIKGDAIKNNQSITQYLKIIDNSKTAQIGVNFNETSFQTISISETYSSGKKSTPIGTIVSSVLKYKSFLEANTYKETENMSKAIWIPCDGRNVSSSIYGNFSGGNVPDLRGVFLRGVNDYDVKFTGVAKVDNKQANPDDTNAGVFQQEEIKSHKHTGNMNLAAEPMGGGAKSERAAGSHGSVTPDWTSQNLVNAFGGNETRPKNITVYYYIKIN